MLGGDASFGAGGWANTELEKAMPVDFQIKNAKVQAVGALVMMMHASEMAQGNYWQKVIGQEALKALGPMDYCGLVHWAQYDRSRRVAVDGGQSRPDSRWATAEEHGRSAQSNDARRYAAVRARDGLGACRVSPHQRIR